MLFSFTGHSNFTSAMSRLNVFGATNVVSVTERRHHSIAREDLNKDNVLPVSFAKGFAYIYYIYIYIYIYNI